MENESKMDPFQENGRKEGFFHLKEKKHYLAFSLCHAFLGINDVSINKTDNPLHLLIDLYPSRERGMNGK